jgi:hypothetical protein
MNVETNRTGSIYACEPAEGIQTEQDKRLEKQ